MKKEKAAAQYASMYANELAKNRDRNRDEAYSKYYDKYLALVTSGDYERFYREHGKNPDLLKIYVALAVYFVSTDFGYSFEDCKNIYGSFPIFCISSMTVMGVPLNTPGISWKKTNMSM